MTHSDGSGIHSMIVGTSLGLASLAVPDGIVHFTVKILVGVVTAFLSGMAYKFGTRLMERKKDK